MCYPSVAHGKQVLIRTSLHAVLCVLMAMVYNLAKSPHTTNLVKKKGGLSAYATRGGRIR